jgi:hypothetical protein
VLLVVLLVLLVVMLPPLPLPPPPPPPPPLLSLSLSQQNELLRLLLANELFDLNTRDFAPTLCTVTVLSSSSSLGPSYLPSYWDLLLLLRAGFSVPLGVENGTPLVACCR